MKKHPHQSIEVVDLKVPAYLLSLLPDLTRTDMYDWFIEKMGKAPHPDFSMGWLNRQSFFLYIKVWEHFEFLSGSMTPEEAYRLFHRPILGVVELEHLRLYRMTILETWSAGERMNRDFNPDCKNIDGDEGFGWSEFRDELITQFIRIQAVLNPDIVRVLYGEDLGGTGYGYDQMCNDSGVDEDARDNQTADAADVLKWLKEYD